MRSAGIAWLRGEGGEGDEPQPVLGSRGWSSVVLTHSSWWRMRCVGMLGTELLTYQIDVLDTNLPCLNSTVMALRKCG
jgi:hypothetical protein